MNRPLLWNVLLIFACSTAMAQPVPPDHATKMAASQALFKESVREVLVKNCLDCHGGAKTKSGLNLASRELLLKGGDRGDTVVPGKPKEGSRREVLTADGHCVQPRADRSGRDQKV